ncbi:pupal cuticle protein C1B-like [Neodiprion fabricii]|uniref:pupal cuticle protein C1B-like n=1 Tax=Neodiprion fabricii TaxID=2872261 RepID=UPI001ED94584|nr:pupal cuticle protein C1B-like [Neodiprion fabricii]
MKSFAVFLIVGVAMSVANPVDVESIEPVKTTKVEDAVEPVDPSVRDKRTLLVGAAPYVAPVAYSAYAAPVAYTTYSSPYTSYPVAYSAYSAYPYYASSYYVV